MGEGGEKTDENTARRVRNAECECVYRLNTYSQFWFGLVWFGLVWFGLVWLVGCSGRLMCCCLPVVVDVLSCGCRSLCRSLRRRGRCRVDGRRRGACSGACSSCCWWCRCCCCRRRGRWIIKAWKSSADLSRVQAGTPQPRRFILSSLLSSLPSNVRCPMSDFLVVRIPYCSDDLDHVV